MKRVPGLRRFRSAPPVRRPSPGGRGGGAGRGGAASRSRRRRRPTLPADKPAVWYGLVAVVGVLVTTGLVMVLSASSVQAARESGSTWTYFLKQSMWTVVGTAAMALTSVIDYRHWRRLVPVMVGGSAVLLCAVMVMGVEVNGAKSWIYVGPFNFQPSELVKLALLLFAADLLASRASRMHDLRETLAPVLVVSGVAAGLVMLQPDLGSTIVIGAIVLSVLFVAGVPLLPLGATTGAAAAAATLAALAKPYRRARLLAFLDPSADPGNTGYQINQSLTGVASGGLLGVGLGESRAKWGFLPNAHTDFIFAIIAEELGLIGALLVLGLFVGLGLLGVQTALRAPDRFGMLVAGGITAWLLTQAFVNVGGVVGLLPITGLTLPFVSFGGTSLLVTMAATGILLNVAANGRSARRPTGRPVGERHPSRRAVPFGR